MSDDRQRMIDLIDSLRAKGSYESARADLNRTAATLAEQISRAIPGGKPWTFSSTSEFAQILRHGSVCEELPGGIALKPDADPVVFDPPFTATEFRTAAEAIRRAAAEAGAAEESSLFDDSAKREYLVSGNGRTFRMLQMKVAVLTVSGDCHLLQKVIDAPPGRMP